ncbi:MAG TPA: cytochrome P450 [Candidatus Saccharimonadia bacterium]|nr:cytochrome P450 [Candidatus Saccharimonadia bacterium]
MFSLLRTLVRPLAVRAMLVREWWQSGVTYYPLSPRVYLNPYPKYAELRAKDPLHWSPLMEAWVATRYDHVDAMLRDQKRFSNDPRQRQRTRAARPTVENPGGQSMLFVDPPEHTRLRALVNKAFAPQAIAALTPRIQAIVQELLDEIPEPSHFDLIDTLAYPLPVIVMAELLGIPPQDRARFRHWSNRRARVLEPTITPSEIQEANRAAYELDAYFRGVIQARRLEPRDDLISTLVATEEAGDTLTQDELLVMLRLLLIAGNETTTNLIGNGMLALLRYPDQLQKLRQTPDRIDTAVEEMLRYDTPVQLDFRTALEDVEIGGRRITRGQGIMLLLGAANHDPEVFHAPEQFDIARREASHLSFGRGVHHCLGAPLARTEARLAFTGLLERFSTIRLLTEHPPFKDNVVLRGLQSLPIGATPVRVFAGP